VVKHCVDRESHLILAGSGEWETTLKSLELKDLQSLTVPEDDVGLGEVIGSSHGSGSQLGVQM
jgi:hypothetical protein